MSVEEVALYFIGDDQIPHIGLVPIDLRSSYKYSLKQTRKSRKIYPSQLNFL